MNFSYQHRFLAVTPDDNADLPETTISVWLGTGGNLAVRGDGDTEATVIPNVPGGTWHPVHVRRIYSTNTTASDIVICY